MQIFHGEPGFGRNLRFVRECLEAKELRQDCSCVMSVSRADSLGPRMHPWPFGGWKAACWLARQFELANVHASASFSPNSSLLLSLVSLTLIAFPRFCQLVE